MSEQPNPKKLEFIDTVKLVDGEWLSNAFMIDVTHLTDYDKLKLDASRADSKFTDTSIGGNRAINPKPQYTRYCDIRRTGRRSDRNKVTTRNTSGNYGMGRYYSKAIDDPSQLLIMEFGVPEFQSLFSFFTRAVDYKKSVIANEGRNPIGYTIANAVVATAAFIAFPVASILIYGSRFINDTLGNILPGLHDSRYYTLKPTMHNYWGTVNTIVTYLATERGILIPEFNKDKSPTKHEIGVPIKINQDELNSLRQLLPDILSDSNYIDVFAIATRSQRIINQQLKDEARTYTDGSLTKENIKSRINLNTGTLKNDVSGVPMDLSYDEYLKNGNNGLNGQVYKKTAKEDQEIPAESSVGDVKDYTTAGTDGKYKKLPGEEENSFMENLKDYYMGTVNSGGTFASFNVEYVGSVTDTFSNSIKDIPAKDKLNSLGGASRDVKFSLSGGNILGDVIKTVTDTAKDVTMGALEGATFGLSNVLQALMGGGYVDMPKMWENSNATLSKHTYKMVLTSPYGNPISQIMNIDIPLAMILAGTLPIEIGNASYTSPYICKSFLRGMQDIDLGMITDLSITRGTTNLGYTESGRPLSIEVSFTITDFSTLMAAPINSGVFGAFNLGADASNTLNRFLSTLTARDRHTSKYMAPKALLQLSRLQMGAERLTSPAYWGTLAGESAIGLLHGIIAKDVTSINLEQQS